MVVWEATRRIWNGNGNRVVVRLPSAPELLTVRPVALAHFSTSGQVQDEAAGKTGHRFGKVWVGMTPRSGRPLTCFTLGAAEIATRLRLIQLGHEVLKGRIGARGAEPRLGPSSRPGYVSAATKMNGLSLSRSLSGQGRIVELTDPDGNGDPQPNGAIERGTLEPSYRSIAIGAAESKPNERQHPVAHCVAQAITGGGDG